MSPDFSPLISLLAFIFPAYVANAAPVVLGGGQGVDGGLKWSDGRRLLGRGKTLRGTASGIAAGFLAGAALSIAFPSTFLPSLPFYLKLACALALSVGAMVGDITGSFLKRRLGFPDGTSVEFLDQLAFLATALLLASPLYFPGLWWQLGFLVAVTYFLHKATNWAAHRLRLKKVPW